MASRASWPAPRTRVLTTNAPFRVQLRRDPAWAGTRPSPTRHVTILRSQLVQGRPGQAELRHPWSSSGSKPLGPGSAVRDRREPPSRVCTVPPKSQARHATGRHRQNPQVGSISAYGPHGSIPGSTVSIARRAVHGCAEQTCSRPLCADLLGSCSDFGLTSRARRRARASTAMSPVLLIDTARRPRATVAHAPSPAHVPHQPKQLQHPASASPTPNYRKPTRSHTSDPLPRIIG